MKKLLLSFLISSLTIPHVIYCQDGTDVEIDVGELLKRIEMLETQLAVINNQNKYAYEVARTNIITAIKISEDLNDLYYAINGDIGTANIYNTIADINSPTSDRLGFKFTDVILNTAKSVFNNKDLTPQTKGRFFKILDKIVKNPVVSTVVSNVPVLGMAQQVVTAASTFFSKPNVTLKVTKNATGKVKDVKVESNTEEEILSADLQKFIDTITPFIEFYEKLQESNVKFSLSISNLQDEYQNLPNQLKAFNKLLLDDHLSISPQLTTLQKNNKVDDLFEYSNRNGDGFSYAKILAKQPIREANNRAKQVGILVFELENFYAEYVAIVTAKFESNKEALESAKKLKGSDISKINSVIGEIDNYMKSNFINRYDDKINKIKAQRRALVL